MNSFTFWMGILVLCFALFSMGLLLTALFPRSWRWLKGSRRSYFKEERVAPMVIVTSASLRNMEARRLAGHNGAVLEVGRGFLRRSQIFGTEPTHWSIKKSWQISNPAVGYTGDRVSLVDREGIAAELATRIISRYSSLEEMWRDLGETKNTLQRTQSQNEEFRTCCAQQAERIAQLEEQLAWSKSHEKTWLASLETIRQNMESDRQRYRSQAAENVRVQIEHVLEHARSLGQLPNQENVEAVKRLLEVRGNTSPAVFSGKVRI